MKNYKKILLCGVATLLTFSLFGCGQNQTTNTTIPVETISEEMQTTTADELSTSENIPTEITVTSLNEAKETIEVNVPFNPQRVAVLDMAVLDIMDNLEIGNQVIGMVKGSTIDYLSQYAEDDSIANLGTLKEVDMEALMSSEPDVIFIGGRLSAMYEELSKIAPVIYLATDYEIGYIESMKTNVITIASIFGLEESVNTKLSDINARVEALSAAAEGKSAIIGLVTSSNFNTLGDNARCSMIGNEIGFTNIANDVDSTHGNESSFELLTDLNPDYIFVLDRDSAINAEGAKLAKEVMDNELVQKTTAYQDGNIVYLTPSVWYLAEGGLTATDVMLQDLEANLIK